MTDQRTTSPNNEATLTISRVFDAPRGLLFKAWTEPKHLTAWWAPSPFTVSFCEVDPRPGGTWRIDMQGPDGAVYPNKGRYIEIVEPERIVYSDVVDESNADAWGETPPPSMVNTVLFEEEDGKTKVTSISQLSSVEERDKLIEMGAEAGFNQTLDQLAAHLKTL